MSFAQAAGGAAVGIVGAGAQWINSEKGRKASAAERDKMMDLINQMQEPDFDTRMITPEQYKVAAKYVPEIASFIEEQNPELVKASSEGAVRGREAQLAALDKLRNLGDTGEDTQSQIMRQQAIRDAQIANQGAQGRIQQNMNQRGVGGSGMELVSSLLAQQGAAQATQQSSENAAMQAYQRRLDAMRDSAALGGDIRDSDIDMESRNAGILNDYNSRVAAAKRSYGQNVADTRNQAQQDNIANKQRVMDANVGLKNTTRQGHQDMINDIRQREYNNAADKVSMQTGQYQGKINDIASDTQAKNAAIQGLSQAAMSGINTYGKKKPGEEE
jgi:hypothetical protein